MDVHEYLKKVSDQIAVPGIRGEIEKELNAHLEDQKEAFMMEGMEEAEAEKSAVLEMGDPVEVGIQLNEIHKPKPVKKYVAAFLGVNAAMFAANALRVWMDEAVKPDDKMATVLLVGLMMFFMVGLYLNMVYQKWERKRISAFTDTGILAVYFVCTVKIFDSGDAFFSLLMYTFVLFMFADRMRNAKYAGWYVLLLWCVATIPEVYLLWETPFLLMEVSCVYAGIFTLLYKRNWFPGAKKFSLCLYWGIPAICISRLAYLFLTKESAISVSIVSVLGKQGQTYLYDLCRRFGIFPAYVLLILGAFAEVKLLLLFRDMRSEWGKMTALAAALILGVIVLNGGLTLVGVLPEKYLFAPFLWKIGNANRMGAEYAAQTSQHQIDFTQVLLYYLYIGYLTRFTSRDSLLNLEMNALQNGLNNPEKNRA